MDEKRAQLVRGYFDTLGELIFSLYDHLSTDEGKRRLQKVLNLLNDLKDLSTD